MKKRNNSYIIYGNNVKWNDMRICIKTNEQHKIHNNEKCDFELNNSIPECIYKGPNTAIHLCMSNVNDLLKVTENLRDTTTVIPKSSHVIIKTAVIFIILDNNFSVNELNTLDNKLQSIRRIEFNEKKNNGWKKDNNYSDNSERIINNLERHYITGYIAKHGYYKLPISFREIEVLSNVNVRKELEKHKNSKILLILEHKKENSKPYGMWDYSTVGGGFNYGESNYDCIIRETYEESGILMNKNNIQNINNIELPPNLNLKIENSNTINVFKYVL